MSEPHFFQVVLLDNQKAQTIQVGQEEHIWDEAFKAGIALPALCHQGYCLTCAARLENGGETGQSDSEQYYPEDCKAGFVLLCTGKPRSDLQVVTHQAKAMREFRKSRNLPAPLERGLDNAQTASTDSRRSGLGCPPHPAPTAVAGVRAHCITRE